MTKKAGHRHVAQADLSTFQFLTFSLNGKKVWLHRPSTCFRLSHVQDKLNIPYRGLPWGNSTLNEFARTVGPSFPPSSIVRNSLACTMRTRWRQMLPALDLDDDPCYTLLVQHTRYGKKPVCTNLHFDSLIRVVWHSKATPWLSETQS